MNSDKDPTTTATLRDEIDRGKAGDKVGFSDAAAAPLGTDAEAGGAPPTEKQIRLAYSREIDGRPDDSEIASGPRAVSPGHTPRSARRNWTILAVLIAVLFAGLLLYVTGI